MGCASTWGRLCEPHRGMHTNAGRKKSRLLPWLKSFLQEILTGGFKPRFATTTTNALVM